MIIYADRVAFDNPCVAFGQGPIDPRCFTPRPKNPTICKLMIQMGRYEELGSGVLNVSRYVPLYAGGAEARFEEGNTFRVTVPLTVSPEVTTQVTAQVTTQVERLLNVLSGEMTRSDAQAAVGLNNREHFRHNYLQPALQLGLIEMTIPKNPNSRLQKYRLTEKGKATVEMIRRSIE